MKKLIKFSIAAAAISASCAAFAASDDGIQVDFSGKLVSSSCNVSVNSGQSSVDMGNIDTSTLSLGDSTTDVPFNVDITNCPSSVTSAALDFEGTAFPGNTTVFSLTSATGNAMDHMALQIKDQNSGSYLTPSVSSTEHDLTNGTASIPLAASLKVMAAGVDDGDFTASTSLHVIYQ